jgi:hypothetical protein
LEVALLVVALDFEDFDDFEDLPWWVVEVAFVVEDVFLWVDEAL